VLLGEAHRFLAVTRLADDVKTRIAEHLDDVEADEGFVLGDDDPADRRTRGIPIGHGDKLSDSAPVARDTGP